MNAKNGLQEQLEANLANDEHLRDYAIEVINENGMVTLKGELPSQELADTAEAIARRTENVITVINEILINRDTVRILRPPMVPR
jgi:osmotically-inducible protein OsmY